ncbi:unnamed protein product [Commensalibacter communis]|uniref:hypothetical protein n=1 Tax=Commensalibacter communis TaxID=2972786 RepID=UPI0022FFA7F3|nr:hypothetical protein [Commensalibacter communis]CAI3959767.1 unnamed protein product [Commensalibacter communis]CAI3960607.1 unnamed protein product [Commensalibacter communis]CAI3961487.1 unnamed protein product [Commensalibacter communis]
MTKENSQITQKSTVFSKKSESTNVTTSIRLNQNTDAWLISYATSILNLIKEQEAVQFVDSMMGDDEARNHCIADEAHRKSQELNQSINIEKAEKGRQEEQAFDGATENFLAQLKTILYGLSLRSESLSDSLYKAGYKDQLEIAEQCGWVV